MEEVGHMSQENLDLESCSPLFPKRRGSVLMPRKQGKPEDIIGLGLVLHEMVSLSPHLSL